MMRLSLHEAGVVLRDERGLADLGAEYGKPKTTEEDEASDISPVESGRAQAGDDVPVHVDDLHEEDQ